jgi:hypothetical protein
MPINTPNAQHTNHLSQWQRCRDAVEGQDAVKARGEAYLPRLTKQTDEKYAAYKLRAMWYGAAARTIQGLSGAVMRKEPVLEVPKALETFTQDVTQTGVSFSSFAKTTLEEVLKTGRYGVLVDMPTGGTDTAKPYYAGCTAESIINWKTMVRDGVRHLTLVVLKECEWETDPKDRYVLTEIAQYRELRIDAGGLYEVETFREDPNKKDTWVSQGIVQPTFRGSRLDYIPFCFFGPTTLTPDIEKPPILDLVDVNLSHYRSSADLEHGRHFCGLPTPWVAGFPETTTLEIGSSTAWVSSSPEAHAGMLEFTGQGLGALEKALESKERLMAVLGARMLEEQKKTVEASDTLSTRLSCEQSVLRSVASTVSAGLSKCLEWAALWMGVGPDEAKKAKAKLNTDFMDTQMTFAELEALVRTWQAGAISYETMYYNMERGEVTRPGIEAEEERQLIDTQKPNLSSPDLTGLSTSGQVGAVS